VAAYDQERKNDKSSDEINSINKGSHRDLPNIFISVHAAFLM